MERIIKPLTKYRHFKGNVYTVLCTVMHTETNEQLVVYVDDSDSSKRYARPIDMFLSEVDKEKYPEITQQYRFEEVTE